MTKRFSPCLLAVLLVILVMGQNFAHGQDIAGKNTDKNELKRFELDEMVITGSKTDETLSGIPRNVSVITSGDIAQAPGNNIVDLLGREGSVNLKSFFGSDKWSAIDIRGMGDTAVSNVVVMKNGFRLNPPDLSGPDFSSIPLDSIERIEIMRGAASVLYGDGAVGGVINIITKKARQKPETRASVSYGSYDTLDTRASSRGMVKKLGYGIYADYFDTQGYRDNGSLTKKDAGLELGYDVTDALVFSLTGTYHEDSYGLPGSVSMEDMDSADLRKRTEHPDDRGNSQDKGLTAALEWDLGKWGLIKAGRGYRWRDTDYVFDYSPLISRQEQTSTIHDDTRDLDVRYIKKYGVLGREGRVTLGLDGRDTGYVSQRPPRRVRYNTKTENRGVFGQNRFSLTPKLDFHTGYRYAWYDGLFRKDDHEDFGDSRIWVNGNTEKRTWSGSVYDLGLGYDLGQSATIFADCSTSFRIPNADELAAADDDLHPQDGFHVDLGARYGFKSLAEISLTFFHTRIIDEIYYYEDPASPDGANRNYQDPTLRQGVEAEAKCYPLDELYIWLNYTWMTAKFEGRDTSVPLVPEHKASLGAEWQIGKPWLLAVTGTYVGERFDGNDAKNHVFAKLDPYTVVDAKLTYSGKGWKVFAGINNLFDAMYETLAYSQNYYPMPTRNFYGGVEVAFGFPDFSFQKEKGNE